MNAPPLDARLAGKPTRRRVANPRTRTDVARTRIDVAQPAVRNPAEPAPERPGSTNEVRP